MSILGYSSSYFLPDYWANTPLYGEKFIPLFDYILSSDYEHADKMAQAFYDMQNKYTNTELLPIDKIEAIIDESGYSYVKNLLGNNEESLRLLVNLMVLVHQLKGTKLGIYVVLNLLRKDNSILVKQVAGNPTINTSTKYISDFTLNDYVFYNGFTFNDNNPEFKLKVITGNFNTAQCIASAANYGLYIGVDTQGRLNLSLSSNRLSWDIANNAISSRQLSANTEYYIRLIYDGYEYSLQVSTDDETYISYISVESSTLLGIENGALYLGVDYSTNNLQLPFSGAISYANFAVNVENMQITQWFEQTPVGPENTFIIDTDLDTELVSSDFFKNFADFTKNYVYPSLRAFTAKLKFKSELTFLPYVRSKMTYISNGTAYANFMVKNASNPATYEKFCVLNDDSTYSEFNIVY